MLQNSTMITTMESEPLWWIPITYTNEKELNFNQTKPNHWMKAERSVILPNLNTTAHQWVIFNVLETGNFISFFNLIHNIDRTSMIRKG